MKKRDRDIPRLTDDEIARRAEIARADRIAADRAWKKFAPARFRNILNAKPHANQNRGQRGR